MTIATEPTDVPIEPTDLREVPQDEAEQLVDEPVGDEAEMGALVGRLETRADVDNEEAVRSLGDPGGVPRHP